MTPDLFLRTAVHKRSLFFKLWNQLQSTEERFDSLENKLTMVFEKIRDLGEEIPPAPRLSANTRFVSMLDSEYPALFHELSQPPLGIFVQGNLGEQMRGAIVGSRKPLPYSRRLTREMAKLWVSKGISIVSGGALGIDGDAHQACVEEGGHTIVVLGGGFMRPHPRSHIPMFQAILKTGGALISEYPPNFEARPYTFPERNRLIAALGDFLFLAQAHDRSGSLSTARTALDLGREIYVLRPIPGDPNFSGSQALVDAGARVLIEANQIEDLAFCRA
jgi:DNA processing protein